MGLWEKDTVIGYQYILNIVILQLHWWQNYYN
jgi:hypothetical protein